MTDQNPDVARDRDPEHRDNADSPVALVTGASRGIGRAIAEALAPSHHLLLGGRDRDQLDTLAAALPSAEPWAVDLHDPGQLEQALTRPPAVDVLVHSAGTYPRGPVGAIGPQEWRSAFQLNVFAPVRLTQALLPALRARRGRVVFINSGAGLFSYRSGSLYSATKFALKAFADTLRLEEEGTGVRVTSVFPGRVATDLLRETVEGYERRPYDPAQYLRPEEVADAVVYALSARPEIAVDDIRIRPAGTDPVR